MAEAYPIHDPLNTTAKSITLCLLSRRVIVTLYFLRYIFLRETGESVKYVYVQELLQIGNSYH